MFLAITFSLTNCAKEVEVVDNEEYILEKETDVSEGVPFVLYATSSETKTVIDDFNISWEGGVDQVNVYHAVAGSTGYIHDGAFSITVADAASGRFTGTLETEPSEGNNYDWYVFYPYIAAKDSPASLSKGYATIGCTKAEGEQTQIGNNNTAHLAGSAFPLYGKVTDVAYNAAPTVTMSHLAAYVEFNITNNSPSPLTISKIKFDAPQDIIGTFYINFSDPSDVRYKSSGASYVASSVTLNVTGGTPIPVGESAKFYIGIKPMAIEATEGSPKTISITINDEYSKDITLKSNTNFPAGKVKKINFNYDYDPSLYANATFIFNTLAGLTELGISAPASAGSGTELTGPYEKNDISLTFDANEGATPKSWNKSGALELRTYVPNKLTFDAPSGFNITDIKFSSNGSYSANIGTYSGDTWTGSASQVILTRTGSGNHASNTITVMCEKAIVTPTITDKAIDDVAARGSENLEASVSFSNFDSAPTIPTVTPDGTIITSANVKDITAAGCTLVYTISNNLTGAARAGSVTIVDSESHSGTVTINQVADVFTVSRTSIELNANSGATATFTVNSDFDWTIDDSSLSGFSVSPNSFTYTSTRSQTVTITATGNNSTDSPVDLDIFCVTRTADSKDSDDITVTQKSGKLAAPVLTITPDAANNKFTVSWSAVSNATKYEYYVLDKDMNNKIATTQTADASTLSFEVTSINLGENYYVGVKAIGNSNPWIDSAYAEETVNVAAGDKAAKFEMTDYFDTNTNLVDGQTYSFGAFEFTFEKHNSSTSNYNSSDKGIRFYQNDKWIINAGTKKMKSIAFTTYGSKPGPFTASDTGTCSAAGTTTTWTAKSSGGTSTVTLTADAQIRFKDFTITYVD